MTLTSISLERALERIGPRIPAIRERLNEADRALGDGDTGMTFTQVVNSWRSAGTLPDDIGTALIKLGTQVEGATGSTLGMVVAIALATAGKRAAGKRELSGPEVAELLDAAAEAISARSGATAGAKTVLDSILAVRDALKTPSPSGQGDLAIAARAAADVLDEYRPRESQLGRARIHRARSQGRDDPGMLAARLLLEAALTTAFDRHEQGQVP